MNCYSSFSLSMSSLVFPSFDFLGIDGNPNSLVADGPWLSFSRSMSMRRAKELAILAAVDLVKSAVGPSKCSFMVSWKSPNQLLKS